MTGKKLDYTSYLKVDEILSLQEPISAKYGQPAHVEMLYIVVHQVYELWFKVILHEFQSVMQMFEQNYVDETNIGKAVAKLNRVCKIQGLLIDQVEVLETMTPLQFLDFRNYLGTASGFQSFQFRLLENKLGLRRADRPKYGNKEYFEEFDQQKQDVLLQSEKSPSMLKLLESWLERTPFLSFEDFDFRAHYRKALENLYQREREVVLKDSDAGAAVREQRLAMIEANRQSAKSFIDQEMHDGLYAQGKKRLSFKASCAALFINLYRDEPILHMPYRLLTSLTEIDENFTQWRGRHALLVHRMLGEKMGTGQSSGHRYLMQTVESARVFRDLFDLSTFLVPRSVLPPLPEKVSRSLGFYYSAKN